MEFVEGASLHTLRQQKENEIYRWPELRPILLQLCSALDHAHGVQLIHRDLKPANILIDLTGRVKLADFGISASLPMLTWNSSANATPAALSPS